MGALLAAALAGVAACSSSPSGNAACVDGASSPCACANGASGSQVCASAVYGACACDGATSDSGTPPEGGNAGDAADASQPDAMVSCLAPTCTLSTGTNKGTCTCTETLTECAVSEITGKVVVPASNGCDEYHMLQTIMDEPDTINCCAEDGYAYASQIGSGSPTVGARCQCNPWYCHDQPAGSTYNCVCAVSSPNNPSDGSGCDGTTCCLSDLGGSCECAERAMTCPSGYHSVLTCSFGVHVTNDEICPKGWTQISSTASEPGPTAPTDGCHARFVAAP